jgi:Fe-Mn family superoxide dismutase
MFKKVIINNRAALSGQAQRGFATAPKAERKHLPYEISALEPVISGHLMDFHYNKHHKTYVDNFNKLTEQAQEAFEKGDLQKFSSLSHGIKFNAGGHYNHTFFWESLAPPKEGGGARPDNNSDLHK